MGLDIKFNLSAAVAAGMAMRKEVTGTAQEIEIAEQQYAEDPCVETQRYVDWLKADQILGNIPDYALFFNVDVIENNALVRANTWGSLYDPLTSFLCTNNITWYEI
jgi:hypothetical protein